MLGGSRWLLRGVSDSLWPREEERMGVDLDAPFDARFAVRVGFRSPSAA